MTVFQFFDFARISFCKWPMGVNFLGMKYSEFLTKVYVYVLLQLKSQNAQTHTENRDFLDQISQIPKKRISCEIKVHSNRSVLRISRMFQKIAETRNRIR